MLRAAKIGVSGGGIRLLGSAGLTLGTIQQLLPCVQSDKETFEPCDDLRAILKQHVGLIDARIGALSQSREILAGFLSSVAT